MRREAGKLAFPAVSSPTLNPRSTTPGPPAPGPSLRWFSRSGERLAKGKAGLDSDMPIEPIAHADSWASGWATGRAIDAVGGGAGLSRGAKRLPRKGRSPVGSRLRRAFPDSQSAFCLTRDGERATARTSARRDWPS